MNKLQLLIFLIISISFSSQAQEFDIDDFEFHGSSKKKGLSYKKGWLGKANGLLLYGKGSLRTFDLSHIDTQLDEVMNPKYRAMNFGGSLWFKGVGFGYDKGVYMGKTQEFSNGQESYSKGASSMFYIHKSLYVGKRMFMYASVGLGNQKIEFSLYDPSDLTVNNAFQVNDKLMTVLSYKSMNVNPEINFAYTLLGKRKSGLTLISSAGYNKAVGSGEWGVGHVLYDGGGAVDLSNAYIMFGVSLSGIR